MQQNSPTHNSDDDNDIGEIEEIYEVDDDDDLSFLEEDGAIGNENEEIESDDENYDNIQTTIYNNHKGSVFSCALSPTENIAASGGEDDKAYVWNVDDASTIFECSGHRDSVTALGFSHDGGYLATGDMGGYIQVWKISTKSRIWEFETDDLNWLTWHPSSNILFAGTNSGEVWMWLVTKGSTKSFGHSGVSADCGSLTRDGKRLCVGYADGSLKVLDLKSGQAIHSFDCHENSILCLSCHQDNSLILSGSADGKAKLLNAASGKELGTFICNIAEAGENEDTHSVEAVSFSPTHPNIAVTATLSGFVSIWDISSQTSRHHIIQGHGSSLILWHPKEPYFLTAGLDGKLRVYDVRSAEQKFKFKGSQSTIMCADIKKDGSKIITSFDDGTVRVLNIENILNT